MIDYNNLDNYYTGISVAVDIDDGGIIYEFGDSVSTLFYKLDDDHYVDVNNNDIQQVMRDGVPIRTNYVVIEKSLRKVKTKKQVKDNTSLVKRLTFKPSKYITK